MKKPRVICHMMSSINGRIIPEHWGSSKTIKQYTGLYEKCHESYDSQGWMVGRVTMEKHFAEKTATKLAAPKETIARTPFTGDKKAGSFAVAVDAKGKLRWKTNKLSGDHIIAVLTEQVSDAYLYYLQQKKVSYIFAGKKDVDFKLALKQLAALFNISTLMLEGGGLVNGSLLNAGLIDELSILIVPVADGNGDSPTTFETGDYMHKNAAAAFDLKKVKQLAHGVLWLKYKAK